MFPNFVLPLFLALAASTTTLVCASSHDPPHQHRRTLNLTSLATEHDRTNGTHLSRRGFSGRATFFEVGLGACGVYSKDSDYVSYRLRGTVGSAHRDELQTVRNVVARRGGQGGPCAGPCSCWSFRDPCDVFTLWRVLWGAGASLQNGLLRNPLPSRRGKLAKHGWELGDTTTYTSLLSPHSS